MPWQREVVTSTEFGKGKDNTNTMIQKMGNADTLWA